jgi:hypothetical protein
MAACWRTFSCLALSVLALTTVPAAFHFNRLFSYLVPGIIDNEDSSSETALLIKEGQLKKCKMGGKLSNVQWKKYNFSLFNDSIHYSKKYDSQVCLVFEW